MNTKKAGERNVQGPNIQEIKTTAVQEFGLINHLTDDMHFGGNRKLENKREA